MNILQAIYITLSFGRLFVISSRIFMHEND